MDQRCLDAMHPQHLGCDVIFALELGRCTIRRIRRHSFDNDYDCCDNDNGHIDVSNQYEWCCQRRRNILYDIQVSETLTFNEQEKSFYDTIYDTV